MTWKQEIPRNFGVSLELIADSGGERIQRMGEIYQRQGWI